MRLPCLLGVRQSASGSLSIQDDSDAAKLNYPFAVCCQPKADPSKSSSAKAMWFYFGDRCTGQPITSMNECPSTHEKMADDVCDRAIFFNTNDVKQACEAPEEAVCCQASLPSMEDDSLKKTKVRLYTIFDHDICKNRHGKIRDCESATRSQLVVSATGCPSYPIEYVNLKGEIQFQLQSCASWTAPRQGMMCCQHPETREFQLFYNGDPCTERLLDPPLVDCHRTGEYSWPAPQESCFPPTPPEDEREYETRSVEIVNVNSLSACKTSSGFKLDSKSAGDSKDSNLAAFCCKYRDSKHRKKYVWVTDYDICSSQLNPVSGCPEEQLVLSDGEVVQLEAPVGTFGSGCSATTPRWNLKGSLDLQLGRCLGSWGMKSGVSERTPLVVRRPVGGTSLPFTRCCEVGAFISRIYYDGDYCSGTPLRRLTSCPKGSTSTGCGSGDPLWNKAWDDHIDRNECKAPAEAKCCKVQLPNSMKTYRWVFDYDICTSRYVEYKSCEEISALWAVKDGYSKTYFTTPNNFDCTRQPTVHVNIHGKSFSNFELPVRGEGRSDIELGLKKCWNWSPVQFASCCRRYTGSAALASEYAYFYDGDPCTGAVRGEAPGCISTAFPEFSIGPVEADHCSDQPFKNINHEGICEQPPKMATCCEKTNGKHLWIFSFDACTNTYSKVSCVDAAVEDESGETIPLRSPSLLSTCKPADPRINVLGKAEEQFQTCPGKPSYSLPP